MGKIDVIFHEIISDEDMVNAFDYKPSDFPTIDRGVKSRNKYVKAIATMLLQYDKKVEEVRMDMRIKNQTGKVVMKENVFESIYRKLVKDME